MMGFTIILQEWERFRRVNRDIRGNHVVFRHLLGQILHGAALAAGSVAMQIHYGFLLWNTINPFGKFIQQLKWIAVPDSNDLFFVTVVATTFVTLVIILIFSQHRLHKIFDAFKHLQLFLMLMLGITLDKILDDGITQLFKNSETC